MIPLYIVLGVLLLIALLRVGVSAEYGEDGLTARAYVGPVPITLYSSQPRKPKKEKPKKKKKAKKEKEAEEPAAEKPGKLAELKKMLPAIKKALSRLRRRLLVNELTVYFIAAGSVDPAKAAMSFGYASIGYGVIEPILDKAFKIRKRDLRTAVNFVADEPYIYVKIRLSLAVWEVLTIAAALSGLLLSSMKRSTSTRKAG